MRDISNRVDIPDQIDVRALRLRLGLSQLAFASRYGISQASIAGWENGRRQPEPVTRAYLRLIEIDPELVLRMLKSTR